MEHIEVKTDYSNVAYDGDTLLYHFTATAKKLKKSKLENLDDIKPHLDFLKERTGFLKTDREAIIFTLILAFHFSGGTVSLKDLSEYLNCPPIEMVGFILEINTLKKRGCICQMSYDETNVSLVEYTVYDDLCREIVSNEENIKLKRNRSELTMRGFCNMIVRMCNNKAESSMSEMALLKLVADMEDDAQLPFVKKAKKALPNIADRIIYYTACDRFLESDDSGFTVVWNVTRIYGSLADAVRKGEELLTEKGELMESGLVEVRDFSDRDAHIKLNEKGIRMLVGKDASAFIKHPKLYRDKFEFVRSVGRKIRDAVPDVEVERNFQRMYKDVSNMEMINVEGLEQIEKVRTTIGGQDHRALYWLLCQMAQQEDSLCVRQICIVYDPENARKQKRKLKDGTHCLQKLGFLEIGKADFFDSSTINLTAKGLELFYGDDAEGLAIKTSRASGIVEYDKIREKNLFFTDETNRQIGILRESLEDKKYNEMCKRLRDNNLPTGVTALFYGGPGTGKTETAMQIARVTQRNVVHVNIAETKSFWFGESEKLIKEVFDKYRSSCDSSKIKPILLFNEADAVFSKRKSVDKGNVVQTENAIQNIILEEMESLEGILIATTNMTDNLDTAFERRFLFKVKFDKPTIEAKKMIWKDKLNILTDDEADRLAKAYDLSGGEIDNIVRKVLVDEIVGGQKPTIERIEELCKEEKISKNKSKTIGFGTAK